MDACELKDPNILVMWKIGRGGVPRKRSLLIYAVGAALLVAVVAAAAWAADGVLVEDWRSNPLGTRGIPSGWKGQSWGLPIYNLEIVSDRGQPVLRLQSTGDSSTISRDLNGGIDLKETPIIKWTWKAIVLPSRANACQKETDDQAAQVYVAWLRTRIIGYLWDSTAPIGTICKSQKMPGATYVIVRSGPQQLGKWITESRNVLEDFRRIYGETPDKPSTLALSIDSDDTRSNAHSLIGAIAFTRRAD
jgi:Protein of unknown function (DUF3047)